VARVSLRAWRMRGVEKPYQFGHGRTFKIIKWPPTWYGAYALLETLGRYPQLWRGANADPADMRLLVEPAACLVAYNVSPEGTVTPVRHIAVLRPSRSVRKAAVTIGDGTPARYFAPAR
jgi:hypothetical protein